MPVEVRPFRRADREQLAALVNAHVGAVLPGVSISVNALLRQLEREPDELIVDPWVLERRTLVALEDDAVVAGAHVLRYGDDARVGPSYRGAAEIRWLVVRPEAPAAGDALVAACLDAMAAWGASRRYADGTLPVPAVYGVPDCWPHVRALYARTGFRRRGHVEVVAVAPVAALPAVGAAPLPGLALRREVGACGTRLSAVLGAEVVGLIEVETDFTAGGTRSRLAGWADVGNLHVAAPYRRRGVGTWLVARAAEWLRLGRVERLLAYAEEDDAEERAFLAAVGFRDLVRTERGWVHTADG